MTCVWLTLATKIEESFPSQKVEPNGYKNGRNWIVIGLETDINQRIWFWILNDWILNS